MTVNKYRFSDRGIEREIQIPIEQGWDVAGRDDAIDVFEEAVQQLTAYGITIGKLDIEANKEMKNK